MFRGALSRHKALSIKDSGEILEMEERMEG